MMFENKELLTKYMIDGHIHLGKKDYGFFNNIKHIIQEKNSITSNQNKLFNKLLVKYQRQLKKLGFDLEQLTALRWNCDVIETKQEYLNAVISYNEHTDNIEIRSPFNTKFVQNFRRVESNLFFWDKAEKIYKAPFSTYQFKIAYENVKKYYKTVSLCANLQKIIDDLKPYDNVVYWTPTLVKVQNNFYIAASNNIIMDAIKDIKLSDDPKVLFQLSLYGVSVDPSIIQNDEELTFASSYDATVQNDNINNLGQWLKSLGVEHVILNRSVIHSKQLVHDLKYVLSDLNISCDKDYKPNLVNVLVSSISYRNTNKKAVDVAKLIYLQNSKPVLIR